ncbi:MAG: hypothetical protein F6J96_17265 [Symploca sp. SIO1C2]|nr:hypothetical protein [Symploca sp. SIO1C2]
MLDLKFTLFFPMKNTPKLLVSSLLVGLLSTINTTAIAQSAIAPLVAQSPSNSSTDAVVKRLQGRWEVEDPSSGEKLIWIFTQEGELFMVLPYGEGTRFALPFGYQIDPTSQPMHLDVSLPQQEEKVLTILEFTADGELRVQIEGTNPGEPRPTAFNSEAAVFSKVDDATTLPPDAEVIDAGAQVKKAQESEGKTYIGAMNRVQQIYMLERKQFVSNLQELGLGIEPETEIYRYQILPQGDGTQQVMMTATAKVAELRSYTGAVFVIEKDGQSTTVTAICETDQPSSTPPAMPTPPSQGSAEIQCPSGSNPVR